MFAVQQQGHQVLILLDNMCGTETHKNLHLRFWLKHYESFASEQASHQRPERPRKRHKKALNELMEALGKMISWLSSNVLKRDYMTLESEVSTSVRRWNSRSSRSIAKS